MEMTQEEINRTNSIIIDAVKRGEGADSIPYQACFAQSGKSGLSYGRMQNDVTNQDAQDTFKSILRNYGLSDSEVDDIATKAINPGVSSKSFSEEELELINNALSSDFGRATIDARDAEQSNTVISQVNSVLEAAARNPNGAGIFDPDNPDFERAVSLTAAWVNRTGDPDKLRQYVEGNAIEYHDGSRQISDAVTLNNLETGSSAESVGRFQDMEA